MIILAQPANNMGFDMQTTKWKFSELCFGSIYLYICLFHVVAVLYMIYS